MQSLFPPPVDSEVQAEAMTGDAGVWFTGSPQKSNPWPSFAISVCLHVIGVLVVPQITTPFFEYSDSHAWMRQHGTLQALHIRIPEQFYVSSQGPVSTPEAKPLKPTKVNAASGQSKTSEPQKTAPGRKRFQLPALPRRFDKAQTILQAQFPPELAPSAPVSLPEMFFWAPQKELPRYVKPFVQPGHAMQPAQPRVLDSPPKLELPASEPVAMNVPASPDSANALRLLASTSLPVQMSQPQGGVPHTGVSADTEAGDPTTVLSLAEGAQRMREYLNVPPGNQLGELHNRVSPGTSTGSETKNGAAAGNGNSHGEAAGNGSDGATGKAALRAIALAAAAGTRIVHPATGVFDVVVESAGLEGFPESAGALSGKPIYSAYVRAGGLKDWLLQYCIPAEDDTPAQSGAIVRLASITRFTAPYPRVTMRPPVRPRKGRHIIVHGYITATGQFDELRLLGPSEPGEAEMVLAVLEKWEFRPAIREGHPVRVEILLAIPAE